LGCAAKLCVVYLISRLAQFFLKKDLWLICERFDEARDNGYHFFRYLRLQQADLPAYYVISPQSPDYSKVGFLGNVIEWGSIRHYLHWCLASCVISAHAGRCAPEKHLSWRLLKRGLLSQKSVFLQHGITLNFAEFMFRTEASHDLICSAVKREQEFLVERVGHPEEVVKLTGFCRFDSLHEPCSVERYILLMPTWRKWFRGLTDKHGNDGATHIFRQSDYFKTFDAFLCSPELGLLLKQNDYRLIFYPHYEMQGFLDNFSGFGPHISVADRHSKDVQKLLKEAAVLVTDFSSVSFDFAYMEKPIVYLLPDEERYYSEHFQRGYFDFDRDGFGPATRDPESAVIEVAKVVNRGCTMDELYSSRVSAFFNVRDSKNCERTFHAIQQLLLTTSAE
jgi:CDP-glycerol glycerophosphotransferase